MFSEAIAQRAIGQFPLSVATSLAIESACGVHPEIKVPRAPILEFQELWINVRTLFRNFLGALDKDAVKGVSANEISLTLQEEMDTIDSVIAEYTQGRCKVVYYVSNYDRIQAKFPKAVLRMDSTDRQREYTALQQQSIQMLIKEVKERIEGFDLKLKPKFATKAMIITHYAYDLSAHREFAKLVLLESHTGAIKEFAQWYTKYLNGKDLPMMPFREDFLQIFGDSETFRPFDPKLRKDLIDIATKYRWTAITTSDKINYGIGQLQNPFYRDTLRDMLL